MSRGVLEVLEAMRRRDVMPLADENEAIATVERMAEALEAFVSNFDEDCGEADCQECAAYRPARDALRAYKGESE